MAEAKAFKMIPHCTKDTITYEMEELVRCKDCKNRNDTLCCPIALLKKQLEYTKVFTYSIPDDWFCADGERRESDGR